MNEFIRRVAVAPLKKEGKAEEIAKFITCLVSLETSFITGANIDINRGLAFS